MKQWIREDSAAPDLAARRLRQPLAPAVLEGVRADTAASDAEVARVVGRLPDAVVAGLRSDTGSSADELRVLWSRLRSGWGAPAWRGVLVPALALAASILVAVPVTARVLSTAPAAVEAPTRVATLGAASLRPGEALGIGPSIVATGAAELVVHRLHARGADLDVASGSATFDVDPRGTARDLVVGADDVRVVVKGTVFTVSRDGERVAVEVTRGVVAVTHAGVERLLTAGERWERPVEAVAAGGRPDALEVSSSPDPEPPASAPAARSASAATRSAATVAALAAADAPACEGAACLSPAPPTPAAGSPERLFEALSRAMLQVGQQPAADRTAIEACNRFLDQHPDAPMADEVRAFRVEAAFHSARPSTVVRYADAFLASAAPSHPRREQVARWRAIAELRAAALDSAQTGACGEALPLLRELVAIEQGAHRAEAIAWRAVCAARAGSRDEARRALREVDDAALPPDLAARVRAVRDARR
jgi:hypothetical protein